MDKTSFVSAVTQLAAEKNLDETLILDAVKEAIAAAYRKDFSKKDEEIEVVLRDDEHFATILMVKEVVEEIENEALEMTLEQAKKIKPDAQVGDELKIDVTPTEYGRIAAGSAKQVIMQRLQEAERDALFARFQSREGGLLSGSVTRVDGSYVFLDIEKTNVLLQPHEQIPGEKYFPGRRMRVYLDRVMHTGRGPQLRISRTHPRLVEMLMAQEIPEIEHGEVELCGSAREPGARSKVSVRSISPNIDPVGACIGQRGTRISPVMDELGGERVDVIEWSEEPGVLIARALQPAKVANVIVVTPEEAVDPETGRRVKKRAAVFVEEAERAMAIGKRGQNIRLASNLTGFELDMYHTNEYEAFVEKFREMTEAMQVGGEAAPETGEEAVAAPAEETAEAAEATEPVEAAEDAAAGEAGETAEMEASEEAKAPETAAEEAADDSSAEEKTA